MTARRDGFALIASLWLVVAISSVALFVGARSRVIRLRAATTVERTRAEGAAQAGLEHVRARLTGEAWRDLGRVLPDTVRIENDAYYAVQLHDVGGRLHLNRASEQDLTRLLRALRVDFGDADRLAQRIADWRDGDDFERGRGAEREQYLKAQMATLPANRPFASVDELRNVLGVTESLMQKITVHLTVHGSGLVNVNTASEAVLLSLPGITPEAARALLRARLAREGVTSLDDVANSLTEGAREQMRAAMPELMTRTTLRTHEAIGESVGWSVGSPVRVVAVGLFVRAGSTTFLVQRSVL